MAPTNNSAICLYVFCIFSILYFVKVSNISFRSLTRLYQMSKSVVRHIIYIYHVFITKNKFEQLTSYAQVDKIVNAVLK